MQFEYTGDGTRRNNNILLRPHIQNLSSCFITRIVAVDEEDDKRQDNKKRCGSRFCCPFASSDEVYGDEAKL